GTRIGKVAWHSTDATPCNGGVEPELVRIDDRVRWQEKPVDVGGSHRLALDFPTTQLWRSPILYGPSVIDFELSGDDGERCLRLPAAAPTTEGAYELTNHWTAEWGLAVVGASHRVGALGTRFTTTLSLGRWIGPFRIAVAPGLFGIASCDPTVCAPS